MKRILLFMTMAILPLLSTYGQGKIDQLIALYGEHSVIRELSLDKWVVCSENDTCLSFALVDDGSNQVSYITLPGDFTSISDFTIFNYSVYFCGMRAEKPVMGFFDILALTDTVIPPVHTVTYSEMTGVDTLTAIKVFETDFNFDHQRPYPFHVVMLGEKNGVGILVEALTSIPTAGWNTYYITLYTREGKKVLHDDLDLLDDYVVVASQIIRKSAKDNPLDKLETGCVWYIKKPINTANPLLTTPYYFPIPYIYRIKQLKLTACKDDTCFAAALAYKLIGNEFFPGIHVYRYTYSGNYDAVRIVDDSLKCETLRNLCYDRTTRKTELLLQYSNEENYESHIYTLLQSSLPWTTLYGRKYEDHLINSLITREYSSEHFVGSGIKVNGFSSLYMYFYQNDGEDFNCASTTNRQLEDVDRMQQFEGTSTYETLFHPFITVIQTKRQTKKLPYCE